MRTFLCTLLLAACAAEPTAVTTDTYLSRTPDGFATFDDCLAAVRDPQQCVAELALCTSGDFEIAIGDAFDQGSYHLDQDVAVGERDGAVAFRLDLATGAMQSNSGLAGQAPWTTPTEDLGAVTCSSSP